MARSLIAVSVTAVTTFQILLCPKFNSLKSFYTDCKNRTYTETVVFVTKLANTYVSIFRG